MCTQLLSHTRLFATPWTEAHQGPLSMGYPRQEYWSGLPFPPPGDLPHPGIEPESPALVSGFFTTESLGKPYPASCFNNSLDYHFSLQVYHLISKVKHILCKAKNTSDNI